MDTQTRLPTDTWVVATWDEYIQAIENPAYKKAKGYYHNGQLRIEMTPIGPDHSRNSTIIIVAVNLFGIVKGIAVTYSQRQSGVPLMAWASKDCSSDFPASKGLPSSQPPQAALRCVPPL